MKKIILGLWLPFALASCVSYFPRDLELDKIEIVDMRQPIATGPRQVSLPEAGLSLKGVNEDQLYLVSGNEPLVVTRQMEANDETILAMDFSGFEPPERSLRLTIKSQEDLADYVSKNSYTLFVDKYFCSDPNDRIAADQLFVFADKRTVNLYPVYSIEADPAGHYMYEIFLPVKRENGANQVPELRRPYDLTENDEDICFRFGGGSMALTGFRSNEIVLTSKSIKEVLGE